MIACPVSTCILLSMKAFPPAPTLCIGDRGNAVEKQVIQKGQRAEKKEKESEASQEKVSRRTPLSPMNFPIFLRFSSTVKP